MSDAPVINDFILMKLVWENSSLTGNEKLVSLGLARRYSAKDGYSRYSLRNLAADSGLSLSGLQKILARVMESGEWEAVGTGTRAGRYAPVMTKLLTPQPKSASSRSKNYDVAQNLKSTASGTVNTPHDEETGETIMSESNLPLYRTDETMHAGNIAPFHRLSSYRKYAERLIKRTDISTRGRKSEFNVANLTAMYTRFNKAGTPIEAVDTLLTYQCDNSLALAENFLHAVLGRMTKQGEIVEPKTFKDPNEDKIYLTAKIIWDIIVARSTPEPEYDDGSDYAESL